jgi:molybdopterin-containing oxidoreductase family iron-sulfur binding subunit
MSEDKPKRFWKSPEEREQTPAFQAAARNEFPEPLPVEPASFPRRDFLRAAGFSFAGAALAGCSQAPVEKAIPYLVKPEEIIPGRALYYASTCGGCPAGCGLVVKNRDGRPIKLEGNPDHPLSEGGLCAVGQASILGLYDSHRLQQPLHDGKVASWEEVDRAIIEHLGRIRQEGGAVRLLTGTINSPTLLASIDAFLGQFADARHVERTHGVRLLPRYHFDDAEVILSLDADFLGTWISPVEHTAGYQLMRDIECGALTPSYHIQCESRLSLTGSKADQRLRVSPGEVGLLLTHVAARLSALSGTQLETGTIEECPLASEVLQGITERLWRARGHSLVVCGSQDVATQVLCNYVNDLLGNYGSTIDVEEPSRQRAGDDRELARLTEELREGSVAALLVHGVNPVYDLPHGDELRESISRTSLVVSLAERADETAEAAKFVCPVQHYLETWSDCEAVEGVVSLRQPCIEPLGDTRAVTEILAAWTGQPASAYDTLREHWRTNVYPRQLRETTFQAFWDRAVHDGFVDLPAAEEADIAFDMSAVQPIRSADTSAQGELTLVLYPKVGILDGRHAYNPWLQELPDPITKVTWDNYACVAPATASEHGIDDGDVVRLQPAGDGGGAALELPVVTQPGQQEGVVAVALGYGTSASERFGGVGPQWLEARPTVGKDGRVGVNAATYLRLSGGALQYSGTPITLQPTGERRRLASTQLHHAINVPEHLATPGAERRPVIQEVSLEHFQEGLCSGTQPEHEPAEHHADLWPPDHEYLGARWAMAIDLNACTGCSACVIACQAENNIPVVGKDEVHRQREMHWLRIDRYYSGEDDAVEVAHQPMLCQHCENAPCETVCPVLATVHSEEGLNQQIYNRCVGTRYCANNCPYKVRRFNWFDYAHEDRLQNLVLNPDVTVRSRGIMEKCSFCVQRIQEAKIEAKRQGREVRDGDFQTACQQSCPASAIVFGDRNDPHSEVSQRLASPRRYEVLAEINVKPVVSYLKLVRQGKEKG